MKLMKCVLRTGLLFAFVFVINGMMMARQGSTWAEAKAAGSGKIVAYYLEEDAFAYSDASGRVTGVNVDIFRHFVNWMKNSKGVTLDVEYIGERDFKKFYDTVKDAPDGTLGLGTVTILDRRKQEVQFGPPYINNIAVLISHTSAPNLVSLDEIGTIYGGKKGVAAVGTTLEGYLKNMKQRYYPALNIDPVSSQMDVVEAVAADPNYFAYVDLSVYWPAYDKRKMAIKRQAVGDLSAETFGFIMPLGSEWHEPLEEFFALGSGYRSNPAYKQILMKHLGGEVTKMLDLARQRAQDSRR